MDSTSGKYLYSVARPMPVSFAICDIVTDASPCWPTSATVVSRVASRTAARCASIVSVHSLGMRLMYTVTVFRHYDLTETLCIVKWKFVTGVSHQPHPKDWTWPNCLRTPAPRTRAERGLLVCQAPAARTGSP